MILLDGSLLLGLAAVNLAIGMGIAQGSSHTAMS